jgi:hypothetical protein
MSAQATDEQLDDLEVVQQLLRSVEEAWARGWQPADLLRLHARRADRLSADLLRGLVGSQLGSYPSDTIDRRWRAQLRELGIEPLATGAEVTLAAVRAGRSPGDRILATLLAFLRWLPRLELLTPLPGSAPVHDDEPPAADERVLARVRALLAKAESTPYPAEAETFTAGAQALMSRHSISAAMLAASAPRRARDTPGGVRIGVDPPYESPKAALLSAVADANRCRSVWSKDLGFCTVVGFDADLQAVEAVYTSLLVQATSALQHVGDDAAARSRAFRRAFLLAFATRMHQRLVDSAREQTEQAVAELGEGRLLPVLAGRTQQVEETFDQMFPSLQRQRRSRHVDPAGWAHGWVAAEQAVLGPGLGLDGGTG